MPSKNGRLKRRMHAEADPEKMRRSWEQWWHGRTGESRVWEQDTSSHIREIVTVHRHELQRAIETIPTGKVCIVMCPGGVWFDTDRAWDNYPFDVFFEKNSGAFELEIQTGAWLRTNTLQRTTNSVRKSEETARDFLLLSGHALCTAARETKVRRFIEYQDELGDLRWSEERIAKKIREMRGDAGSFSRVHAEARARQTSGDVPIDQQ